MRLAACCPDSVSRFPWFQSSPVLLFCQCAEKPLQASRSSFQISSRPTSTASILHICESSRSAPSCSQILLSSIRNDRMRKNRDTSATFLQPATAPVSNHSCSLASCGLLPRLRSREELIAPIATILPYLLEPPTKTGSRHTRSRIFSMHDFLLLSFGGEPGVTRARTSTSLTHQVHAFVDQLLSVVMCSPDSPARSPNPRCTA